MICPRQDYDDLVAESIEARADADRLQLLFDDAQKKVGSCQGATDACRVALAKAKEPNFRPVIGFAAGVVGTVLLALAPKENWGALTAGATIAAAGLVLTLPF